MFGLSHVRRERSPEEREQGPSALHSKKEKQKRFHERQKAERRHFHQIGSRHEESGDEERRGKLYFLPARHITEAQIVHSLIREEFTLKVSEHTHGKLFPTKHRTYKEPGNHEKKSILNETCPCCVGVIDLDEAASLAKVGSAAEDKQVGLRSVNPVPGSGLEWAVAGVAAYFSLAGLYFGYINLTGTDDRLNKLKIMLKENSHKIEQLREQNASPEEVKNLEVYEKNMKYSIFDGRFVKWGEGATPLVGSAGMLGSVAYGPLTAPGLGIMSLYAMIHVAKFGVDWNRLSRVDVQKLGTVSREFEKKGLAVFRERIRDKTRFYKQSIGAWGSYGAGAGILTGTTIASLAGGVVFPPLLAVGATLLVAGVFSTLYLNNFKLREYTPKNQDRVKRQFLGHAGDILAKLKTNDTQAKNVKTYEKLLRNNLKKALPKVNAMFTVRKSLYVLGMVLTLGVPKFIRGLKHKNAVKFVEYLQRPKVQEATRQERNRYFAENLKEQLAYLKEMKENIETVDVSFMKRFREFREVCAEELSGAKQQFKEYLELEIRLKEEIRDRFLKAMEGPKPVEDFDNAWLFALQNGIMATWFEKVFDALDERKLLREFEEAGFIEVKQSKEHEHDHDHHEHEHEHEHDHKHEHDHHEHEHDQDHDHEHEHGADCADGHCHTGHSHDERLISFKRDPFLQALARQEDKAMKLYRLLNEKLDHAIINDLKDEFEYQRAELSNHLEERLRRKF